MCSRPAFSRVSDPADILPLDLVKEYIGLDPDLDVAQDRVLPELVQAAIEYGEQITGTVWAAAQYQAEIGHIDGYCVGGLRIPLSPVSELNSFETMGEDGLSIAVSAESYRFMPSDIAMGRPWATVTILDAGSSFLNASLTVTAGWNAKTLPGSIRGWILARVATLYDIRQDVALGITATKLPRSHVDALLDRWSVRGAYA